jgi:hypothetical protein
MNRFLVAVTASAIVAVPAAAQAHDPKTLPYTSQKAGPIEVPAGKKIRLLVKFPYGPGHPEGDVDVYSEKGTRLLVMNAGRDLDEENRSVKEWTNTTRAPVRVYIVGYYKPNGGEESPWKIATKPSDSRKDHAWSGKFGYYEQRGNSDRGALVRGDFKTIAFVTADVK